MDFAKPGAVGLVDATRVWCRGVVTPLVVAEHRGSPSCVLDAQFASAHGLIARSVW